MARASHHNPLPATLSKIVFGLALAFLITPRLAIAQQDIVAEDVQDVSEYCDEGYICQLESYSAIYDSSTTVQLDWESETAVNIDAIDDGYDAYDCVSVTADGDELGDGCTGSNNGPGDADIGSSISLDPANTLTYQVVTSSYLADIADDPEACDDGDPEYCIGISETSVYVTIGPVQIESVTPSSVSVGASGTLTFSGQNMVNPFGGPEPDVTASLSGSSTGISFSNANFDADGTSGTVDYRVASNSPTGNWTISVSYTMGNDLINDGSDTNFLVGYPPAVITNINPSTWTANSTYTVTITGQNFGNSPTLTVAAPGVALQPGYTATPNGQSIQATVAVAANAPTEATLVTVQPNYTGQHFVCNCDGGSPNATSSTTVDENLPPPAINLLNGTNNQPWAGQPLSLSVSAPNGLTIVGQNWGFSDTGHVVGGWQATASSLGCYVSVTGAGSGACPSLSVDLTASILSPFYFIIPGVQESVSVGVNYKMADGSKSPTISNRQNFVVNGPTGNLLPNAWANNTIAATAIPNPQQNPATLKMVNAPADPNVKSNLLAGIRFDDLASFTRGSLIWVQILNNVTYYQITPPGGHGPPNYSMQLDGLYPYPAVSANTTIDAPGRTDLLAGWGEAAISFDATMYVLWDPAIPFSGQSTCNPASTNPLTYVSTPSNCASIPIPLGAIEWKWLPCAVDTGSGLPGGTGPDWVVQCGSASVSKPVATGYPTWTSCAKSKNGTCK